MSTRASHTSDSSDSGAPPPTLSVLLADDSVAYRAALATVLLRERSFTILDEVGDGQAALQRCARSRPDIVLADIMMPRLDGVEAARRITTDYGVPVLLMSALARYPDQRPDLAGLPRGLVELIDKPVLVGPEAPASILALVGRIKALVQASAHAHGAAHQGHPGQKIGKGTSLRYHEQDGPLPSGCALVAVAASTGGLLALRQVLGRLTAPFPPMVIAQHIDPLVGKQFAVLLQEAVGQTVECVERSALLRPTRLYVAAPGSHLIIRPGRVAALPAEPGELAPSADRLFTAAAVTYGERALGVVLTGMGRDGAAGLRQLRDAGGWTIAQDPASAVVDGMPRAAMEKGGCCEVLSLAHISERLSRLTPASEGPA